MSFRKNGRNEDTQVVTLFGLDGEETGTEEKPFEIGETLSPFTFLEYAHRHTGVLSTLAVATVVGTDYQITVVDGSVFTVLDNIQISDGAQEPSFPRITAIATNLLTLDRRIDGAHAIGTTVEVIDYDLASTGGTMAAPLEYLINPDDTRVVHIQRITLSMIHGTAGDLDKFGNIASPGLPNGVAVRVRNDGVYRTITNWHTNQDIADDGYDISFPIRSGGGGTFGVAARITFERFGTEIRLDPATNDQLEFYIQDAGIAALGGFNIKGQGHYK